MPESIFPLLVFGFDTSGTDISVIGAVLKIFAKSICLNLLANSSDKINFMDDY